VRGGRLQRMLVDSRTSWPHKAPAGTALSGSFEPTSQATCSNPYQTTHALASLCALRGVTQGLVGAESPCGASAHIAGLDSWVVHTQLLWTRTISNSMRSFIPNLVVANPSNKTCVQTSCIISNQSQQRMKTQIIGISQQAFED